MTAPLLRLPIIYAHRGPISYDKPNVYKPDWLDSDPHRHKWWLHDDLRAKHEVEIAAVREAMDDEPVVAAGGFCAPAYPVYDFMAIHDRPLTDAERARIEAWEKRQRSWRVRLRAWWRRHWWPARIRDLEAQLADDEW